MREINSRIFSFCGNMESGSYHITTGLGWCWLLAFVCGNMENGVSHITTRNTQLFSLIVQSPCGREKSSKKEKRRLGFCLKEMIGID